MKTINFNQWVPLVSFVLFFMIIAGATMHFSPSWGLMDDDGFLETAIAYWKNPANVEIVTRDFRAAGMFRPVVFVWSAVFYKIFEHWPAGLYIVIAAGNMAAMVFWGIVFYRFFGISREDRNWTIFFFPLTFFLFTPFWNIFTYLSLQEKFVVFLAPLALYFFQKTYTEKPLRNQILLYVFLVVGMLSKATFIYVPVVMVSYAFLELVFFNWRSLTSIRHLLFIGISLVYYAYYTVTVQLSGDYTAKYKSGLTINGFIEKILVSTMLIKILLLVGIVGFVIYFVRALRLKNKEELFPCLVYLGLIGYLFLLLPWGTQSYLLSAAAPLVLGAFFPIYAWICRDNWGRKLAINLMIIVVVGFVFMGNNIPSISRMGDIGRTIHFITDYNTVHRQRYFMPPPYEESALATANYTKKDIVYCYDGIIRPDMLLEAGDNFVVFADLFPSIDLSGVSLGDSVYSNGTWKVFKVYKTDEPDHHVRIDFPKTIIQKLKVKIRDL